MNDPNQNINSDGQWNMNASYSNYLPWYANQHFNQSQIDDFNARGQINPNIQGSVLGLQALFAACTRIYPDQPNPLQVTARLKYWLGGPDPLDYVSMYWNPGHTDMNVPPHWHYVSFGLSDLHGDGRVHPIPPVPVADKISGLGLELSFRMIGEPGNPPTWPAALLQRLATYVFRTGNRLCVGDHISWHSALDGSDDMNQATMSYCTDASNLLTQNPISGIKKRKSKIRHMLVSQDPQLGIVDTPLGKVEFVQIVGVTDRELKASQKRGGQFVLDALAADLSCGGSWFVTNANRIQSVSLPETNHSPSDLSGVAASCRWEYWEPSELEINTSDKQRRSAEIPSNIKEQIKSVLQKGLSEINLQCKEQMNHDDKLLNTHENAINEKNDNSVDCKMSTDSIKVLLNCSSSRNFPLLQKNYLEESSDTRKVTNMSTDSFEMSKMGAALIEDILSSPDNIKEEEISKNMKYDKTISNLKSCTENNVNKDKNCDKESPIEKKSESTEAVENCDCVKNSKNNTSEQLNSCNKCITNVWVNNCTPLPGVHLIFDKEAGSLLPLALRCRVLHGRHFTWTAVNELQAITFVATSVSGALVSSEKPIVVNNGWLQILIDDSLARTMADELEPLLNDDSDDSESEEFQPKPPLQVFTWHEHNLKISIVNNI